MPNNYATNEVALKGRMAEFREALREEIRHIESSGLSSINLLDGRLINSTGLDYQYRFRVEYAPNIPTDTPCALRVGNDKFDVTVISFEEEFLIISSKTNLSDFIGKAQLDNGSTVLMERLIRRLESNAERDNPAGDRLFEAIDFPGCTQNHTLNVQDVINSSMLNPEQLSAVKSAICNDITYIWGPPGTGKTTVIGSIMDELFNQNRSVLLVSHTNTAVDEAIKKFLKWYGSNLHDDDFPILRLGTSLLKNIDKRLSLDEHIRILGKGLLEQKASLEAESAVKGEELAKVELGICACDWLKTEPSRIADLLAKKGIINGLETELSNKKQQLEKYNNELKAEEIKIAPYAEYFAAIEELQRKRDVYQAKLDEQTKAISMLTQINRDIDDISDKILHYNRFHELEKQKDKFVSPIEQRRLIQIADSEIDQKTRRKNVLSSEITAMEQKLENYGQKNKVAKLLSGINITELENKISGTKSEYRQICDEISAKATLRVQYEQISRQYTLIVEEQMAIRPTQSIEELTKKKESENRILEKVTAKRKALDVECETLSADVARLKRIINDTERSSSMLPTDRLRKIESLKKNVSEESEKIEHSVKYLNTQKNEYSAKLEEEYFFYPLGLNNIGEVSHEDLIPFLNKELGRLRVVYAKVDAKLLVSQQKTLKARLDEINVQLNDVKNKISELEKQAILGAKIIGTTLTKAYIDDVINERVFDTVIVDEASMATIPALWCASYLAQKNIVIVGDFKQLPPIAMGNTPLVNDWLCTDIFARSGMQELNKKNKHPENFIVLTRQFRMEKRIADIANRYYKEERVELISDDKEEKRVKKREEFYSWYNGKKNSDCITIINTKELHAWVTGIPQGQGHSSRLNFISATLCVNLAFKLVQNIIDEKRNPQISLEEVDENTNEIESKKAKVLIVSPYKPHTKRVEQLIKLEYQAQGFSDDLGLIRAGTIHSFQGNEAEIVIFDLVIDEPHWKANLFINTDESNENMKKMFNVAITRAMFKLFVVGNIDYCRSRSKDNALGQLLADLVDKKKCDVFDAKKYFPNLVFEPALPSMKTDLKKVAHLLCQSNFFDYIKQDFQQAREQIIIYSAFMTEQRLSLLLPSMMDALGRGCKIIVVTKPLSERGKTEASSYSKCESELRDIGVDVIFKKGMHEKLVFIDKKIIWCGSLNVLSFNDSTGEIMERRQDMELYADFAKQMDIAHLLGPTVRPEEKTCPICGAAMIVAESDEGGFYWQCINKDYSRNADQPHPVDGELRCKKCNSQLLFFMKNEPRWVCTVDEKHYQKVRPGDLKLEKMFNKIPKKEQKKVLSQFEKKSRT